MACAASPHPRVRGLVAALSLLSLLSCAVADEPAPGCALPADIDAFIRGCTAALRGAEYCRFRQVAEDDSPARRLAVGFHVEGACTGGDRDEDGAGIAAGACGNHVEGYVAVFPGAAVPARPAVYALAPPANNGGIDFGGIRALSWRGDALQLTLYRYLPEDARSTPSGSAQLRLRLRDGRLEKVAATK